jgi:hypothetical protein
LTQHIYIYKEELWGRPAVLDHVRTLKNSDPNFTLIDIGASHNPFNPEFLTHTFDLRPANLPNIHAFSGNMNDYEDWIQLFDYVNEHGKFSFCNCSHTLEDIAYPMAALKYMPLIANEGFIAVPSKYYELQRRQLWRGADHHRWIWDHKDGKLIGYPKINLIDYLNFQPYNLEIEMKGNTELRVAWRDSIDWEIINNDYLGPTVGAILAMYQNLIP